MSGMEMDRPTRLCGFICIPRQGNGSIRSGSDSAVLSVRVGPTSQGKQ